jgi:DNA-binding response OmpR family regulator
MEDRKSKILIVEDEEALATVLEAKLKKEGYDMFVEFDGEAGFNKIKEWMPDLILLDIVMPKMDGYEVLEKMNEEGIKIPVIIISNSGQPVEIEKTKKLGAVDHLIKTQFDPKEVVAKVKNYLETSNGKVIGGGESAAKPVNEGEGKLGIKVLLVEDDTFLREICSKKLVKEGFTVFEAVDGEQVIREIDQIEPDIVLLDIILPALDGFGVLTSIRQNTKEKIKTVPVIMLSNLGQEDDIKKAMEIGANNYLVKAHFTTDEIVEKIKTLLNK